MLRPLAPERSSEVATAPFGLEDDGDEPGARRVGRRRRCGVPRRRADDRACALLERLRDRDRHAAVLEAAGRVRALELDEDLDAEPLGSVRSAQERRRSLAERDDRRRRRSRAAGRDTARSAGPCALLSRLAQVRSGSCPAELGDAAVRDDGEDRRAAREPPAAARSRRARCRPSSAASRAGRRAARRPPSTGTWISRPTETSCAASRRATCASTPGRSSTSRWR